MANIWDERILPSLVLGVFSSTGYVKLQNYGKFIASACVCVCVVSVRVAFYDQFRPG